MTEKRWYHLLEKRLGIAADQFRKEYSYSIDALLVPVYGVGPNHAIIRISSILFADGVDRTKSNANVRVRRTFRNQTSIPWNKFSGKYTTEILSYKKIMVLEALQGHKHVFEFYQL